MLKYIQLLVISILATLVIAPAARAAAPSVTYHQAVITAVHQAIGTATSADVRFTSGPDRGRTVAATIGVPPTTLDAIPPPYHPGEQVLVSREVDSTGPLVYTVIDHNRLPAAAWLLVTILILAVVFAGWRGVGSLAGLILSVLVIAGLVMPQILQGQNPYVMTAIGIIIISCLGIFIAHGFSRRTALALLASYATLLIAVALAVLVVHGMQLTGLTDDNLFYLAQARPNLNIQGLLLCGILISLVGVLDDVTVGQAATVQELYVANPKFTVRQAYNSALNIGREHIASLINTLVLAFVGTSFLLIAYLSALSPYPWYISLNSGIVMQEIARALVGSVALILGVPVATLLAAKFLHPSRRQRIKTD